ncbi:MAG: Tfp pilus assembly protein FimT/FimU [Thermodesulfobacteriota bacterium]
MKRLYGNNGFTLVEILVVLTVFTLTISLVFPSILSGIGKIGLKTTTRKMAASLKYSRNQALRERTVYYAEAQGDRLVIKARGSEAPARVVEAASHTKVSSKKGAIAFYPGGTSSGGLLEVSNLKESVSYTINVEPSTGRVHVSRSL